MRAVRALLVVAFCCLTLWPQRAVRANTETILLVWPSQGHSRDTFYLSGHGFRPNSPLSFLVACSSWYDPNVFYTGNWHLYKGPRTNPNGDFSGYPIVGFELKVLPSSPCAIAANYRNGELFVGTALYDIIPQSKALPANSRIISGHVRATPQRVRAGVREQISVTDSWGGATATVAIRFPHQKPRTVTTFHINWRGQGDGSVEIGGSAAQQPGVADVSVGFSLGDKHGSANTSFTVVR